MTYALECTLCGHLASHHHAKLVDGRYDERYRCKECECVMTQDGDDCWPLTRRESQARYPAAVAPPGKDTE